MQLDVVARWFRALGDADRLRIVALLWRGERCVGDLEAALGLTQPSVSRHLQKLRAAGVVEARRQGSWVHYRLAPQADAGCRRQLRALTATLARSAAGRREAARLARRRKTGGRR
jgi:ArsR family transcriptional regulator